MKLRFPVFLKRAGERGYPTTWRSWVNYEKQGMVTFRKTPRGTRIFTSKAEIDQLLDLFEQKTKNGDVTTEHKTNGLESKIEELDTRLTRLERHVLPNIKVKDEIYIRLREILKEMKR